MFYLIFTDIFNRSLAEAVVPPCLKSAIIGPVPMQATTASINNYRPIPLTPILTKCFERLILKNIKTSLSPTLDPHQFAYMENRSTEDAITITFHSALQHLENRRTYVWMLFVDYISEFNSHPRHTYQEAAPPWSLLPSLFLYPGLPHQLPQSVRLGPHISPTITLSTSSPQGCVLSPLLYSLYTYDSSPYYLPTSIIKFADDITVISLISGGDE